MKLIEVAHKVLPRRQLEAWYMRRIDLLEPEETARRMQISVAVVHNYVWLATRTLADHAADIEDVDSYLASLITILHGHKIENETDLTIKGAILRQERALFANKG